MALGWESTNTSISLVRLEKSNLTEMGIKWSLYTEQRDTGPLPALSSRLKTHKQEAGEVSEETHWSKRKDTIFVDSHPETSLRSTNQTCHMHRATMVWVFVFSTITCWNLTPKVMVSQKQQVWAVTSAPYKSGQERSVVPSTMWGYND